MLTVDSVTAVPCALWPWQIDAKAGTGNLQYPCAGHQTPDGSGHCPAGPGNKPVVQRGVTIHTIHHPLGVNIPGPRQAVFVLQVQPGFVKPLRREDFAGGGGLPAPLPHNYRRIVIGMHQPVTLAAITVGGVLHRDIVLSQLAIGGKGR